MKRYNSFTIKINTLDSFFWEWLSDAENEYAYECEQIGSNVFWFNNPPIELFEFQDEFDWISGSAKIWVNEQLVTKDNYRIRVIDVAPTDESEGEYHYEYFNYLDMTDIAPVINDELNIE